MIARLTCNSWLLWLAMSVCGLLQIVSTRFMGQYFSLRVRLHRVSGQVTAVSTVVASLILMEDFKISLSKVLGLLTLAQVPVALLLAVIANNARYSALEWDVDQVKLVTELHRYHGYFAIALQQIMFASETISSFQSRGQLPSGVAIVAFVLMVMISIVGLLELAKRRSTRGPLLMLVDSDEIIGITEFQLLLIQGRQLVILENQVLDIEPILDFHPGGRFVLKDRIGFSIDLPFNGHHYAGIDSPAGANLHQHSNDARLIAQSLVIGRYSTSKISSLIPEPAKPIRVKPSDGWDDSSSYHFGMLETYKCADFYVWAPIDSILI